MVRDSRVKEVFFPVEIIASGGNTITFSPNSINGQIVKIEYRTNNTGSLIIGVSGTNEELFRDNTPSGTDFSVVYPFVYPVDVEGNSGSPAHSVRTEVNNKIFFTGSGNIAGSLFHLSVQYR